MDLTLLDRDFSPIEVLDTYEELVWVDRFREAGDFELKIPSAFAERLTIGRYLQCLASPKTMVIEYLELTYGEAGDYSVIKGRSIESILDRRIVTGTRTIDGPLQSQLQTLVRAQCVSPYAYPPFRAISALTFDDSDEPLIGLINGDNVFSGETVYDVLVEISKQYDIGFELLVTAAGGLSLRLRDGRNRITHVVFTEDNSVFEDYQIVTDDSENKTVGYVSGSTDATKNAWISVSAPTGALVDLARREIYINGSSVSTKDENDVDISDSLYRKRLRAYAAAVLNGLEKRPLVDAQVTERNAYTYNKDYFLGDRVMVSLRGIHQPGRVVEYIISVDANGARAYPTFEY